MKRDMELVRKMLLAMEKQESYRTKPPLKIEGYDERIIYHHAWLMQNAKLILCGVVGNPDPNVYPPEATPICINWEGYEFLDAARDDTIWDQAMQKAKKAGAALPFAVLFQLLTHLAKDQLGINS